MYGECGHLGHGDSDTGCGGPRASLLHLGFHFMNNSNRVSGNELQ